MFFGAPLPASRVLTSDNIMLRACLDFTFQLATFEFVFEQLSQ
jgi:hypothetical protein